MEVQRGSRYSLDASKPAKEGETWFIRYAGRFVPAIIIKLRKTDVLCKVFGGEIAVERDSLITRRTINGEATGGTAESIME